MDRQGLPKNDILSTAFNTYQTSEQTYKLESEKHRSLFADHFKTFKVPPLATICLKLIAQNYKGHPINIGINQIQLRAFFDFLDIELPLDMCINIDDDYYWKRVCSLKCVDKMSLQQKSNDTSWKNLGISIKFKELVENTPYEIWNNEDMERISNLISPFVTELNISKLQAMREVSFLNKQKPSKTSLNSATDEGRKCEDNLEEDSNAVRYDYPIEDCHHVSLAVFRNLIHLQSLTLEFLPPELGINYHRRYFNFSYVDMENLASGVQELVHLKFFKIRRSRMDCTKLTIILQALKSICLEHLEFFFCQLDDECGDSLCEYLLSTGSLFHLNLSGNYLKHSGIISLSNGLTNTPSKIIFLDISYNPIPDESLERLTNALSTCEDITHVKLSGIKVSTAGTIYFANWIKSQTKLEELEIIAVPMDGNTLIKALDSNTKIQRLLCLGSGLTLEEEFKIELLLKRNRYIRDNPYIGDDTQTEEEITRFLRRIKNPILLHAMSVVDRRIGCGLLKAKRDVPSSSKSFCIEENTNLSESDSSKKFQYKSNQLSEKDLDQRITLYGQSDEIFFQKQKPRKINQ